MPGTVRLRKHILALLAILALLFINTDILLSQETGASGNRHDASALLAEGKYSEALKHFSSLAERFPADPVYKYYMGMCMVELEETPEQSVVLLSDAIKGSTAIRTVPPDARYYLARALQQSGRFKEAISQYDLFSEKARKKEVRDLQIELLISECMNSRGAIETKADTEDEIIQDEAISIDTITKEPASQAITEPVNNAPQESVSLAEPNTDYDAIARRALMLQFKADSVGKLANRYRENLNNLSGNDRASITNKIISLEQTGFRYQAIADSLFMSISGVKNQDLQRQNIERPDKPMLETVSSSVERRDSSMLQMDAGTEIDTLETPQSDTLKLNSKSEPEPEPVLELFTEKDNNAKILLNSEMPEGLCYRIQVAAFRNPVAASYFKSLGPIYGFKADNSDITFYFIGLFRMKADADRAVARVRLKGFKDAFVIAISDGQRVSLETAAAIEKKGNRISLIDNIPASVKQDKPAEPLTLVYRVEVSRSEKALPEDKVNFFRKLAGNRQFDIVAGNNNEMVYLIGKFITFESAESYSDLLYRNGAKDVRVTAYLGDREIPLEKAKELFDLYFNKCP